MLEPLTLVRNMTPLSKPHDRYCLFYHYLRGTFSESENIFITQGIEQVKIVEKGPRLKNMLS